jgi:hypothetical protein
MKERGGQKRSGKVELQVLGTCRVFWNNSEQVFNINVPLYRACLGCGEGAGDM